MPILFLHTPELLRIIMSASSATARLLSLAVLVLSLAPLGSIYVLMFSFGMQSNTVYYEGDDTTSNLAQVLKDPNATIEELWTALFVERWNGGAENPFVLAYLPMKAQSAHHLSMVLPWILSLLLGVVIPAGLSIWSFLRQRRRRMQQDECSESTKKRRKTRIERQLRYYTKTLTSDDLVNESSTAPEKTEDTAATWKLPRPGHRIEMSDDDTDDDEFEFDESWSTTPLADQDNNADLSTTRTISGTCAICLNHYQVDESICWSPNEDCLHCFHETCIVSWLLRKRSRHQQCPCCRQVFVKAGQS